MKAFFLLIAYLIAISVADEIEDDCDSDCDNCEINAFERMIVQTSDLRNITVGPLDVFDIGGAKAFQTEFYTPASYALLQERANAWFESEFGINTSANATWSALPVPGVVQLFNPTGGLIGLSFPYGVGLSNTLRVAFDTENCCWGKKGNKVFLSFGRFIQFQASGVLQTHNGIQYYEPGDFILNIDVWIVGKNKTADAWKYPGEKGYMMVSSDYVSETLINSQRRQEQHSKLNVWTKSNGYGQGVLSIFSELADYYAVLPTQPTLSLLRINQKHRAVYTWNKE